MLEAAESSSPTDVRLLSPGPAGSEAEHALLTGTHIHTQTQTDTTFPLPFQHKVKVLAWGILCEWRKMALREIWGYSVIHLRWGGGMRNTSLQCLLAQQTKYAEKHFQAACRWGCRSYTPLCLLHDSSSQNMHLINFETEFMNNKVFHLLDWLYHLWTTNRNKGF